MLENNTKCTFIENNALIFDPFTKPGWEQEAEIGRFSVAHRIHVTAKSGSLFSRRILLCLDSLINTKCHIVGSTAKLQFAVYKHVSFQNS